MSNEKKTYNRRDAVGIIGKTVAAAAVAGTVISTTETVNAQSSVNLDFKIKFYRSYLQTGYAWASRIIVMDETRTYQCTIFFMKDENNIPPNTVAADGLYGELYYPYSRMAELRDFFRYERPIRLTIVAGNGIGTISNELDEKPGDHDLRLSRLVNNTP